MGRQSAIKYMYLHMHVLSKLNCFNLRLDLGNFSYKEMHYDNVKCCKIGNGVFAVWLRRLWCYSSCYSLNLVAHRILFGLLGVQISFEACTSLCHV